MIYNMHLNVWKINNFNENSVYDYILYSPICYQTQVSASCYVAVLINTIFAMVWLPLISVSRFFVVVRSFNMVWTNKVPSGFTSLVRLRDSKIILWYQLLKAPEGRVLQNIFYRVPG